MNKAMFQQLYDYNYWANRKLWECVMTLTEEQYRQHIDFSMGSICVQCVHIMAVEHWWFHFLKTGELDFIPEEDLGLPREEIRQQWDAVEQNVRAYLDTITPEELEREVKPPFWDDDEAPVKVWQALLQVANHGTDHRAQTMAMLHTQFNAPTFGQDILSYLDK